MSTGLAGFWRTTPESDPPPPPPPPSQPSPLAAIQWSTASSVSTPTHRSHPIIPPSSPLRPSAPSAVTPTLPPPHPNHPVPSPSPPSYLPTVNIPPPPPFPYYSGTPSAAAVVAASPPTSHSLPPPAQLWMGASSSSSFQSSDSSCKTFEGKQRVDILFHDIKPHLLTLIDQAHYVVGCVAWVTDSDYLRILSTRSGVCILVQNESYLVRNQRDNSWRIQLKANYQKLRRLPWGKLASQYKEYPSQLWDGLEHDRDACAIRYMGQDHKGNPNAFAASKQSASAVTQGNGVGQQPSHENQPLMLHSKYLIFCDGNLVPQWVSTGSCNLSRNAAKSIENVAVFYDPAIARFFMNHFVQNLFHSFSLHLG